MRERLTVERFAEDHWLEGVADVALHDARADEGADLLPGCQAVVDDDDREREEHGDHGADVGDEVEDEGEQAEHDGQLDAEDEQDDCDDDPGDEGQGRLEGDVAHDL